MEKREGGRGGREGEGKGGGGEEGTRGDLKFISHMVKMS